MPINSEDHALGSMIGRSLRAARQRAELTMDALAERSGVSQPHLSQMENGRVSPSINTLYRLANALGISPQQLLPDVAGTEQLVIRRDSVPPTPIVDSPTAASARVLVGSPDKMLQVQEVTAQPGQDLGEWFQHEGEEFVHVMAGSIEVQLLGRPAEVLETGDSIWYSSVVEHRWKLIAEAPAHLLVISTVTPKQVSHGPGPT